MHWILVILGSLAGMAVIGVLLQRWTSRRYAKKFPPPGEMVDVGGHRLHIHRMGEGTPVVVFDSALAGTSVGWALIQPEVAKFTTACCYDRAGSAWSDPGPFPRSGERIVEELHELLKRARIPGPYILVGHSYGGFTARLFGDRYPESTAGMVLLDAADPEQWVKPNSTDQLKVRGGARLSRRGVWVARLGIARLVVWIGKSGALQAAWKLGSALTRRVPDSERRRLLAPAFNLPSPGRQKLFWFWTEPKFYEALASQIEMVPETAVAVSKTGPYGDLPLAVVSAANADPAWSGKQEEMAKLSMKGRYFDANDSSHWITLDRPELVVRIIREMVEEVRSRGASAAASDG